MLTRRRFIIINCLLIIALVSALYFAKLPYSEKAGIYDTIYNLTGFGRSSLGDRLSFHDPELYLFHVQEGMTYQDVDDNTILGLVRVKLINTTDTDFRFNPLAELRLEDEQGRVFAPMWVQYSESGEEIIRRTPNIRLSVYNPDAPQYRNLIFLLPKDTTRYRLISTDKSVSMWLEVSELPEAEDFELGED